MELVSDFTGFKRSQLEDDYKMLRDLCVSFKTAIDSKARFGDINTRAKLEEAFHDRILNPEHYYSFRWFNKAVSIVYGAFINGKMEKTYHVKTYNWIPENCGIRIFSKDNCHAYFGSYSSLDDCFKHYARLVLTLIGHEIGDYNTVLLNQELEF